MADLYSVRASITLCEGILACYVEMNRLRMNWLAAHEKLPGEVFVIEGQEVRAGEVVRSMRGMRDVIDQGNMMIEEMRRQLAEMYSVLSGSNGAPALRSGEEAIHPSELLVRQTSVAELACEPNLYDLVKAYAAESGKSVHGEAVLDIAAYQRMQDAGLSRTIGAWRNGSLIGFLIVMVTPVPHWGGQVVASTESYFVLQGERHGGVGLKLRQLAEQLAREAGARGLYLSAPVGSRLDKVMQRSGYRPSNMNYFKEFA
ncbi:MAG: GNAT family N-acetyltransferase [Bordetella sp.]|uniref:GNAT family N-acetyltransferase n=1 Tax=Bordetella sp. TaxID=28081 RepID=UPI003F7BD157